MNTPDCWISQLFWLFCAPSEVFRLNGSDFSVLPLSGMCARRARSIDGKRIDDVRFRSRNFRIFSACKTFVGVRTSKFLPLTCGPADWIEIWLFFFPARKSCVPYDRTYTWLRVACDAQCTCACNSIAHKFMYVLYPCTCTCTAHRDSIAHECMCVPVSHTFDDTSRIDHTVTTCAHQIFKVFCVRAQSCQNSSLIEPSGLFTVTFLVVQNFFYLILMMLKSHTVKENAIKRSGKQWKNVDEVGRVRPERGRNLQSVCRVLISEQKPISPLF